MSIQFGIRLGAAAIAAGLVLAAPVTAWAEDVTLDVTWMGWDEAFVQPLMQGFEAAHPGIKVKYNRLPFGELLQTLEIRLGAREATPDVYVVDGPLTASYAARGHLLDLTEPLKDEMDSFTPAAIDQGSWNGKLYSAPFVSSTGSLYYNKDIFAAAGIEPPPADVEKRWTWDQILEVARKLNDPSKEVWGLVIEQDDRVHQVLPFAVSNGAEVISPDGLSTAGYLDSEKTIGGIDMYRTFFTEKLTPSVHDMALNREYFGTGRAAMILSTNFYQAAEKFPDLKWGVAPHPYMAGGKPVTPTGAFHVGINPRSEHQAEAIELVRWLTSEEVGKQFFAMIPYPPVKKSLYEGFLPDTDFWKITRYELNNTAVPRPKTPGFREYEDILKTTFRDIQSGAPTADAMKKAVSEIDVQLQKYK